METELPDILPDEIGNRGDSDTDSSEMPPQDPNDDEDLLPEDDEASS